jgi:acyl carrier protein
VNTAISGDDLTQRVVTLISETQEISREKIEIDSNFEQLGLTSLNALSIVFEIENEFGVTIPDDEALTVTNIRQLVTLLTALLADGSAVQEAAAATSPE